MTGGRRGAGFVPGDGVALISESCAVLLRQPATVDLDALWDACQLDDPLDQVIAVLTRDGVRRAPRFGCAVRTTAGVVVLVRGDGRATARLRDGATLHIDGEPVTTWVEERLDDALDISLSNTADARNADGPWHVVSGVVPADAVVHWCPDGATDEPAPPLPPERGHEPIDAGAAVPPVVAAAETDADVDDAPSVGADVAVEESPPFDGADAAEAPEAADATETPQASDAPEAPPAADEPVAADPSAPIEPESTDGADQFDFAHLLDRTIHFGVEDAAVRAAEAEAEPSSAGAAVGASSFASPPPPPTAPLPPPQFDASVTLTPISDGPVPPPPPLLGATTAAAAPSPPPPPSVDGLIDSVPLPSPPGAASAPPPPPFTSSPPAQPVDVELPDDPNATMTIDQLRALARRSGGEGVPGASPVTGPTLPAVHCPNGHPNAPEASICRSCRAGIVDRTITVIPRPSLGRLRFDTGQLVDLTQPLLIGRKPPADAQVDGEAALAVAIPDPDHALSRLHLEVRFEGWQVLVTDRKSVNSSFVTLPGKPPMQLRPEEPMPIVDGTTVTLGDIVSFVYEAAAR